MNVKTSDDAKTSGDYSQSKALREQRCPQAGPKMAWESREWWSVWGFMVIKWWGYNDDSLTWLGFMCFEYSTSSKEGNTWAVLTVFPDREQQWIWEGWGLKAVSSQIKKKDSSWH